MDKKFIPYFMKDVLARAEKGDGDACFDVAEYFYAQKNYEQAFQWYKKTTQCDNTNPNAFFNLGYAYQYGEGTEKDMFAAFECYQKAADQNLPQAMNNLAFFYESGIVVPQDQEKADELCRQATVALNNLQTELIKEKKAYRQLEQDQEQLVKKLNKTKEEAAKSDKRARKTMEDLTALQEKLAKLQNDKHELQKRCDEEQRKSKSITEQAAKEEKEKKQLRLEYNSLCERLASMEAEINKLWKEKEAFGHWEKEKEGLQSQLKAANTDAGKYQNTIHTYEGQLKNLRETADNLYTQVAQQKAVQESLEKEIQDLKQRKPYIRKKTLLCFLDFFVIGLLITSLFQADFRRVSEFEFVLCAAAVLVAFILSWVAMAHNKYLWYGLLHWVVIAVCFFAELEVFYYSDEGFLLRCVIWLMLLWMGILAFRREKI